MDSIIKDKSIVLCKPHQQLLGKPDKTLVSHCLETAWVCEKLLQDSVFSPVFKRIIAESGISQDDTSAFVLHSCVMHDIGKLHIIFVNNIHKNSDIPMPGWIPKMEDMYVRHESASSEIIRKLSREKLDSKSLRVLSNLIKMHHQGKGKGAEDEQITGICDNMQYMQDIVIPFYNEMSSIYPLPSVSKEFAEALSKPYVFYFLLGILSFSDWIASSNTFSGINIYDFNDMTEYKEYVQNKAKNFLLSSNLLIKQSKYYTFNDLFPQYSPNSLQKTVIDILNENNDILILLIEALMGAGKTEAAFYAMLYFLAKYKKQGSITCLPTGATCETMLPRLTDVLERIEEERPNLVTGTTWLNSGTEEEQEEKHIIFEKVRLLSRHCVSTIDQVMAATMLCYHSELRLATVATKVIIIDEIHSYDAYMVGVIKTLLRYLKAYKVPVIMLSATLSSKAKEEILSVYDIPFKPHAMYPCVTTVSDSKISEYGYESVDTSKALKVNVLKGHVSDFYETALDTVKDGGCLTFIVNTTKKANDARRTIVNLAKQKKEKVFVFLYHAALPYSKRERLTTIFTKLFGKCRTNRPFKAIVIATPVIEMSMDLDFDFMFRQIAPIDAILQAIGRVGRHNDEGTIREKGIVPEIFIMADDDGNNIYGGMGKTIEEVPILSETLNTIQTKKQITFPEDVPYMIETVYNSPNLQGYYTDLQKRELIASIVSLPDPFERTDLLRLGKNKKRHAETRHSNISYVEIAILTEEEKQIAQNGSPEEIASLYKEKVVKRPFYVAKGAEILPDAKGHFRQVYVNPPGYILHNVYGLIKDGEYE